MWLIILIYIAPLLIAFFRKHHSANPIFVVNLFLGWTVIGWIICLAWAMSDDVQDGESARQSQPRFAQNEDLNLVECSSCDKMLGPKVKYCIRCGEKISRNFWLTHKWLASSLAALFIIACIYFTDNQPNRISNTVDLGNTIADKLDRVDELEADKPITKSSKVCDEPDCNIDGAEQKADTDGATKIIAEQIKDCFVFPNTIRPDTVVNVNIKVDKDGKMQFDSILPTSKIDSADFHDINEAVQDAIADPVCNPLQNLPPAATYDSWKEIKLGFSAKDPK